MKVRLLPLIGAMGAALALASCGVRTGLEKPPPMWGQARRDYMAEQERLKAQAAAAAPSSAPEGIPALPPPPPEAPIGATPLSPTTMPSTQPPG